MAKNEKPKEIWKEEWELVENEEYKALVPRMTKSEYEELKASIAKEGLHYPIEINPKREILDGYSRYQACKELFIEPKTHTRSFSSKTLEMKFVATTNLTRRHLTKAQKITLAMKLLKIEKALAKKRQIKGKTLGQFDPKGKAVEEVAKRTDYSPKTVQKIAKVMNEASEDVKAKMLNDEISINSAYNTIMPKAKKTSKPKLISQFRCQGCKWIYDVYQDLGKTAVRVYDPNNLIEPKKGYIPSTPKLSKLPKAQQLWLKENEPTETEVKAKEILPKQQQPSTPRKRNPKTITCTSCGHKNPIGSTQCIKCLEEL